MPLVGFSKSAITLNKVVLPQPLGPISETKSPELTFILISESACTGSVCVSKVRHKLLMSMIEESADFIDEESFMMLFFS